MILKELDPFTGVEPFELAGRRAEEQMAFYLKREFAFFENIYVINGLRLEYLDDACQIDHLIVHPWGLTVIESKSVTTEVRINEDGDWSRLFDGVWRGMPSPVNQAELQFKLLKILLDDNADKVLGKLLFLQKRFGGLQCDVYAAVSDNGILNRPSPGTYPQVLKADGVCAAAIRKITGYRSATGVLGFLRYWWRPFNKKSSIVRISKKETKRTAEYLVSLHRPLVRNIASAPAAQNLAVTSRVLVLPGNLPPDPTPESTAVCGDCPTKLSEPVMSFCRAYPTRFGGRLYCRECQKKYPKL